MSILNKFNSVRGVKSIINQLCDVQELVYFGPISHHDDIDFIKGMTYGHSIRDNHYCYGTLNGVNVSLCVRSTINKSKAGKKSESNWTLVAVDLEANFNHNFVLEPRNQMTEFYEQLTIKYPLNKRFSDTDAIFDLHISPQQEPFISQVFYGENRSYLEVNYPDYIFEAQSNKLIVMQAGQPTSLDQLNRMLSAGLWLRSKL